MDKYLSRLRAKSGRHVLLAALVITAICAAMPALIPKTQGFEAGAA